ncbi:glycerate kinase [Streptomyces sp. NBC_01716]|uniref:glycerate kinase n=1 Tax=Streptomyces sp. NBC_01716 TaxID=2975917 RepID=UPI002E30689A|nr:glycerate kinase [Streptomyces sp. NBC_01716]
MQVDAPRQVVLAPDKFKGTVTAQRLVELMAAAVAERGDRTTVTPLPVADGGDGSVTAAVSAGWTAVAVPAADAWGEALEAPVARLGDRAIVEVASVCGLGARRPGPARAASATTYGVGLALAALLDDGVREITLALGGAAATDGGTGMLAALGVELCDAGGTPLAPGGTALAGLARVRADGLHPALRELQLVLACDVDTPMVGPDGSAEMFARQKGADDATIARLSAGLAHAAPLLENVFGAPGASLRPGAGAAGGLGWAGLLLGGLPRSGAEVFLDLLGAAELIRGADLVITGEGRLDAQSLRGKAPVAVARLAATYGVRTVAVVGSDLLTTEQGGSGPFADVVALDRIDPACADDPELTGRLVGRAVHTLLAAHPGPGTPARNGARS